LGEVKRDVSVVSIKVTASSVQFLPPGRMFVTACILREGPLPAFWTDSDQFFVVIKQPTGFLSLAHIVPEVLVQALNDLESYNVAVNQPHSGTARRIRNKSERYI